jgi:predicted esterase
MAAHEHHLSVTRTARYHTLGDRATAHDIWFVLHGHSQLSAYFIRHFATLDDGKRLIVAPEALNRFYLEPTTSHSSAHARIGATWMTREDRLAEIGDYVAYLDRLYEEVLAGRRREDVSVTVLGFSQGVSTACRWLAGGRARAERLILWAGPLPHDMDAAAAAPLRGTRIIRVLGDADDFADAVGAEDTRLAAMGLEAEMVRFAGGHQVHVPTLEALAR